ncbi:MAG: hypothetical protein WC700_18325 [Gemmatimonadaceae bacterium]|jgi:hypothetical protein
MDDNVIAFPAQAAPKIRPVYEAAISMRLFIHVTAVTEACEGLPVDVAAKWGDLCAFQIDPAFGHRYDMVTADAQGMVWPLNFGGREAKVFIPWGAVQGLTVFQRPPEGMAASEA